MKTVLSICPICAATSQTKIKKSYKNVRAVMVACSDLCAARFERERIISADAHVPLPGSGLVLVLPSKTDPAMLLEIDGGTSGEINLKD